MIKATLVFGLEADTYKKTITEIDGKETTLWNLSIGKTLLEDATALMYEVIAENYPTSNFYVEWLMGDNDLKEYSPEGRPMTKYTVVLFDEDLSGTWSMKNINSVETQLNETFTNKFVYAYGDVDLDYPDGVWCNSCTKDSSRTQCKNCGGEKIITYESLLND
jgi:hypothetical protein